MSPRARPLWAQGNIHTSPAKAHSTGFYIQGHRKRTRRLHCTGVTEYIAVGSLLSASNIRYQVENLKAEIIALSKASPKNHLAEIIEISSLSVTCFICTTNTCRECLCMNKISPDLLVFPWLKWCSKCNTPINVDIKLSLHFYSPLRYISYICVCVCVCATHALTRVLVSVITDFKPIGFSFSLKEHSLVE